MDKRAIPLFIIEEHHEAFYVWNYAVQQQLIPSSHNSLLHVDEHSDMSAGRFKRPIYALNGHLEDIRQYTYAELRIDTFLSATIAKGIIDRICWVKQQHSGATGDDIPMFVSSLNNEGKKLSIGKLPPPSAELDIHPFTFSRAHVPEMPSMANLLLDIDLDFFSCAGNPYRQQLLSIEVSQEQYDEYTSNPYHMLNYHFTRISADKKDDRCYFIINDYDEIYLDATYVSEDVIRERIALFVSELQNKAIVPNMITICRSRHSGYTPADQWEFIETMLLHELNKIYALAPISYQSI